MTRLIELFGYPGSGKSSASRALAARGLVQSPPISRMQRQLEGKRWPVQEFAMRACLLTGNRDARDAIILSALQQRAIGKMVPTACVMEEGVLQEIWRQLYHDPNLIGASWWRRAVSLVADDVVVLDIRSDIALQRIHTKATPGPINRRLKATDLHSEEWSRAQSAYQAIKDHLLICSSRTVFWLENESMTLSEVVAWIEDKALQSQHQQGIGMAKL